MGTTVLWLVSLAFTPVLSSFARDIEDIGKHACNTGDRILNDCNWCHCQGGEYLCEARNCKNVDMFGHFNDAIKDIDVGMEGHGTWRTTDSACEAHVHYRRGNMLCVCGDDGVWPNPACRDIFRVLHPVETTDDQSCTPMKLYLDKCNVCFCPSTGRLDPKLCTKETCHSDDPVLDSEPNKHIKTDLDSNEIQDVYAECNVNDKYQLDCRTCTCLRNNRLLCGNCTKFAEDKNHYCKTVSPNVIFNIECNLCFCDEFGRIICSVKRCLGTVAKLTSRRLMDIDERYFELVERTLDLHTCKIGTKYKKGCNTCICLWVPSHGPTFACTVRRCKDNESLAITIREGCVLQTTYELNCLKCSCVMTDNEKWQWCATNNLCSDGTTSSNDLSAMNGYCEPLHGYNSDCNRCECLSDGQTVICSDMKCDKTATSVEIIPILQKGHDCPRGQAYKLDCNICYCLLNGNSLCTTLDCTKKELN